MEGGGGGLLFAMVVKFVCDGTVAVHLREEGGQFFIMVMMTNEVTLAERMS